MSEHRKPSTLRFGGPAAAIQEVADAFAADLTAKLDAPHWVRSEVDDADRKTFVDQLTLLARRHVSNGLMEANHLGRKPDPNRTINGVMILMQDAMESDSREVLRACSRLAEAEAEQLSSLAGRLLAHHSRFYIGEMHRMGVDHAATADDHDRPTIRTTPKP